MVNRQQWLTFNFTHYAMLLKVLLILKAILLVLSAIHRLATNM